MSNTPSYAELAKLLGLKCRAAVLRRLYPAIRFPPVTEDERGTRK